jgi:hypothetical protein
MLSASKSKHSSVNESLKKRRLRGRDRILMRLRLVKDGLMS